MRPLAAITLAALLALVTLASAASAPPVIPVAGLSAGAVQPLATLRTSDGGAILVARLAQTPTAAQGRIVVVRLLADGAPDLSYGTEGLVQLPLDARALPTALAVSPLRGDAWVGAGVGHGGAGAIVALDANGALRRAFGSHGILDLPAADAGGPAALDWSAGRLFVAAGTSPCRGCRLSALSDVTGRPLHQTTLAPAALGPAGCGASVSSAAFVGSGREMLATDAAKHGCVGTLVSLGANLVPAGGPGQGPPGSAGALVADGGGASWGCIASASPAGVQISSYSGMSVSAPASAPGGSLVALAPIAQRACGALIATRSGGVVAQMASGDRAAVTARVPAGVAPSAIFRCHQHLLVIGVQGASGRRTAVVLPFAVRRGASSAALTTGCGADQQPGTS